MDRKEWLEERNVPVIPLRYTIDGETYTDMYGLSSKEFFAKIREGKMSVTSQVNPDEAVAALEPFLKEAEMFLIMSVEPGFGGQAFIPESLHKIKELRSLLDERDLSADIEVDGGIYHQNVGEVLKAGANVIVSGSGVFKGNITENTEKFMEILKKYE